MRFGRNSPFAPTGVSGSEALPPNNWDLYFLMQHYGAPTRLLDWTESALIALYFAVRDNPGYYDSAVYFRRTSRGGLAVRSHVSPFMGR